MRHTWDVRYRRWLDAVRALSALGCHTILLVDDGSPVLPDWTDLAIWTEGEPAPAPRARALLYHFRERLGRRADFDFEGWYRSFAFAGRYARENGFDKAVHIESDAFLTSLKIQRYIADLRAGWTALWCHRYEGFPETAIQIIAGDAIGRFADIERTHPHESLIGRLFELQLPFDVVEKQFTGDRYGEYLTFVPRESDYVAQTLNDQDDGYYWWLLDQPANPMTEGLPSPLATTFVFTGHGTVLFVDPDTLELRHGRLRDSPRNVVVQAHGRHVQLMHLRDGMLRPIFCLPEGSTLSPAGQSLPPEPQFLEPAAVHDGRVSLRHAGLYVCAELDGRVTLSRPTVRAWEMFAAVSETDFNVISALTGGDWSCGAQGRKAIGANVTFLPNATLRFGDGTEVDI
jgi:hypothetical protein